MNKNLMNLQFRAKFLNHFGIYNFIYNLHFLILNKYKASLFKKYPEESQLCSSKNV